jgi:hypothetical protein
MLRTILALFCILFAVSARADDGYAEITWGGLLNSMIRFNAIDLMQDNALLDEYAAITDCDLYQFYYQDDFKWQHVRDVMRQSMRDKAQTYPVRFRYDVDFQLDRYDFANTLYRFSSKRSLDHIGKITVIDAAGIECGKALLHYFPKTYAMRINPTLTVPGLKLQPQEAKNLLDYMNVQGNTEHQIHARINLSVTYVEPAQKVFLNTNVKNNKDFRYVQSEKNGSTFILDGHVDSVNFYRDPAMTELVYTFVPQ